MPVELLLAKQRTKPIDTTDKHLEKLTRATKMQDYAKKTAAEKNKIQKKVDKAILKRTPFLLDKMFELAEGVYILDKHIPGKMMRYYKTLPDRQAITWLWERALGKTREAEAPGAGSELKEGLQAVESIIKTLADEKNEQRKERKVKEGAQPIN